MPIGKPGIFQAICVPKKDAPKVRTVFRCVRGNAQEFCRLETFCGPANAPEASLQAQTGRKVVWSHAFGKILRSPSPRPNHRPAGLFQNSAAARLAACRCSARKNGNLFHEEVKNSHPFAAGTVWTAILNSSALCSQPATAGSSHTPCYLPCYKLKVTQSVPERTVIS
jgi:hypothetical protein